MSRLICVDSKVLRWIKGVLLGVFMHVQWDYTWTEKAVISHGPPLMRQESYT